MKTILISIIVISMSVITVNAQMEQKEVLIIGTMHTVPKIVKHSYKPILKRAKKYSPLAIYVESPQGNDSLSWSYLKNGWSKNYQAFYQLSDSIKNIFNPDLEKYNAILEKSFQDMSAADLDFMISSFIYQRDNANYEFYNYIKKHGYTGVKKPTRHEDGDLTFKLALAENIKLLKSMDDQQTNGEYHAAWSKCSKEGQSNGNNAINIKLNKKEYNAAIIPALFRGLGKHTNKRKSLERLHNLSSFNYVRTATKGCTDGKRYWNERNMRMANNIANQVIASNSARNIVIVGASHVIGLEKELKRNYPSLKVVLYEE
ncbi:DUF5694 domain-containing protein [Winogradskyella bathintestinalis]|uniref:DUF5694 domain-containing protein n=1 Tax=Winogradskyella bathintestinalis TaxID=3035208 RepID=A0ABT7ZXP8_9FLAO|nr:DUF5694 domain-containing protein [Winogradskyella bathintestinalis]MDN3493770.1 DUF5694 domain-containing protein [Winogradskyella bathintestinalis]